MALMVGCGSQREPLGPVTGQVRFEGEPVTEGMVVLANREKGVHMTAPLGEGGRFEFQTSEGFGLPLGDYTIAVMPPIPDIPEGAAPDVPEKQYPNIPVRYRSHATSGLTTTVTEDGVELEIELTSGPVGQ